MVQFYVVFDDMLMFIDKFVLDENKNKEMTI